MNKFAKAYILSVVVDLSSRHISNFLICIRRLMKISGSIGDEAIIRQQSQAKTEF
jgi:hypothetical protein